MTTKPTVKAEQWGSLPSGERVVFRCEDHRLWDKSKTMTVMVGTVIVLDVVYVSDRYAEAVRDRLRTVFQR
jgi:hypothetical protein